MLALNKDCFTTLNILHGLHYLTMPNSQLAMWSSILTRSMAAEGVAAQERGRGQGRGAAGVSAGEVTFLL